MNINEARKFIEETKSYGSRPGLDSIRSLMEQLADPQEKLKLVHIAGTNAKGTVGTMIAVSLAESGYKTGYFSSPAVYAYEEMFQINGRPASREKLAQVFTKVRDACCRLTQKGLPHPTKFEVETAAAFVWFYESGVDAAVLEVGMGGKLDATNLITRPCVSVLTPIAMDHMGFLGKTLPEIAAHKAGIIKAGCPVVSFPQKPEVMDVIREACREKKAELTVVDMDQIQILRMDEKGSLFTLSSRAENSGKEYSLSMPGLSMVQDAACTYTVLQVLKAAFPRLTAETFARALAELHMQGRMELTGTRPQFILDGGHNPAAIVSLRNALNTLFPDRKIVYIMGVLADKDYETDADIMFPKQGHEPEEKGGTVFEVYTVTPPDPRALDGKKLAEILAGKGCSAVFCKSSADAVRQARTAAGEEGLVAVFGSFTILAGIREAMIHQ